MLWESEQKNHPWNLISEGSLGIQPGGLQRSQKQEWFEVLLGALGALCRPSGPEELSRPGHGLSPAALPLLVKYSVGPSLEIRQPKKVGTILHAPWKFRWVPGTWATLKLHDSTRQNEMSYNQGGQISPGAVSSEPMKASCSLGSVGCMCGRNPPSKGLGI